MHVLLNSSEFGHCVIIKLAFIIPDSCNENDLVAGHLHADPNWWPQSKLFDILSIQRLELRKIADEQGHLEYEWNHVKSFEMLKNHQKLIFLVHFLDLLLSQVWIDYRYTELYFLLNQWLVVVTELRLIHWINLHSWLIQQMLVRNIFPFIYKCLQYLRIRFLLLITLFHQFNIAVRHVSDWALHVVVVGYEHLLVGHKLVSLKQGAIEYSTFVFATLTTNVETEFAVQESEIVPQIGN